MKKFMSVLIATLIISLSICMPVSAKEAVNLNISTENITHEVSSTLFGAFIEDISKAGDGGLVGNLVYNNSFEYNDTDEVKPELNEAYWIFDNITHSLLTQEAMNENNPSYEMLTISGKGVLSNIGCVEDWDYKTWNPNPELQSTPDMGFEKGVKYDFSAYIKNIDFNGTISVYLNSKSNKKNVETIDISAINTQEWTKVQTVLESVADEDGSLSIVFDGNGSLLFDFAQLVSQESYGYGDEAWKFATLRADLAQTLVDMNPSFIRFPGGCYCEGDSLQRLFDWKKTIGPVEERLQTYNVWRNDWAGDYYISSNALGYGEYFNLCADIGAEPLPCLNVGLTCQGRNNYDYNVDALKKLSMTYEEFCQYLVDYRGYWPNDEEGYKARAEIVDGLGYQSEADWYSYVETIALTPGTAEWDSYVQDILDLIEFANGDAETTKWGKLRAEYGHPEPYNLKFLELGNENWGEIYWRNFKALYAEVKAVYPDITIITTAGTTLAGDAYDYAWEIANESYKDCYVDEHYYTVTSFLYGINDRYDSYTRDGAKVFVGEYAATADGYGTMQTKANMIEAVEEATYMTAFERNSDVVAMTCYAPTFAKVNSQNWAINEIWFDSQCVAVSPTYYSQMLFMNNIGTQYIACDFDKDLSVKELAHSVTIDEEEQAIFVKIVNSSGEKQTVNINLDGIANVNYVSNQNVSEVFPGACNEVGKSYYVTPSDDELKFSDNGNTTTITLNAEKYSVNVIRIAYGDNDGSALWQLPETIPASKMYLPPALRIAIPSVIALLIVIAVITVIVIAIVKKHKAKKARNNEIAEGSNEIAEDSNGIAEDSNDITEGSNDIAEGNSDIAEDSNDIAENANTDGSDNNEPAEDNGTND